MTVPTYRSREDYTGNGATTSYPYQFRIYEATDLVVTRADTDGNETTLVLNTDYTVTGVGKYAGGNVVLTTVLLTGYRLAIERALPITQETDLRNQGAYFAETHEDVFDRTIMLLQRFASYLGFGPDGSARTILLGKTDIDGSGSFRARQNRIQDLSDPVNDQDAANKRWSLSALRAFILDNNAITTSGTLVPVSQDDAVPAATGGGNVSQTMNAMVQTLLNKVQYVRDTYLTRAAAQTQSVTAFTSAGVAPSFTLTPSPVLTAYASNTRFRVKFHANGAGSDTLNVSGLGAKSIKHYDSAGNKVAAIIVASQLADVEYDGVDFVILDPLPAVIRQIQPITASVAANALTLALNPTSLDFRASALNSGAINTRSVAAAISLTVPSGATLGTINGQSARLALLAIDNAGTVELAVANSSGGVNLDETTLISTTAISAAATSASVIYSTTARASVPFRVVGFIDITETAAGTWASAPTTIQGGGGQVRVSGTSMVRLNTPNGYGSTNNKIRRFTNVVVNQGVDITYSDSATLGASFTINTPGVYAISYGDQYTATSSVGLSLNTTVPTSQVYTIPVAEILSISSAPAPNAASVAAWTGQLKPGDIVRPHTDGTASGTTTGAVQFTITRIQ